MDVFGDLFVNYICVIVVFRVYRLTGFLKKYVCMFSMTPYIQAVKNELKNFYFQKKFRFCTKGKMSKFEKRYSLLICVYEKEKKSGNRYLHNISFIYYLSTYKIYFYAKLYIYTLI